MRITTYELTLPGAPAMTLALAADLHCHKPTPVLRQLEKLQPDLILSSGDMMNNTGEWRADDIRNAAGLEFLTDAGKLAPVYYSLGNHEGGMMPTNREILTSRGIHLLDNSWAITRGLVIGGLSSALPFGLHRQRHTPPPAMDFIKSFQAVPGINILLCHHPEYWSEYIVGSGIELTLSGHAHGGQWSFFGKDVYAPGQGMFPKYASGSHKAESGEMLIVSRGLANTVKPIPRLGNPTELVLIRLSGE